jgi:hypothetical protein
MFHMRAPCLAEGGGTMDTPTSRGRVQGR